MILGTGIDLVEVDRMRATLGRFGDRFLERVLRPGEIEYCRQYRDPVLHVAARFAAKEAISKAFGTGIGARLSWLDLEVGRQPSGEPFVILHGKARGLMAERGADDLRISLSHTDHHAIAMAVLSGPGAEAAPAQRP